jgi:hypothetical protein
VVASAGQPNINDPAGEICFCVNEADYKLLGNTKVAPRIELYEGSTVMPASLDSVNLMDANTVYTVSAEDPSIAQRRYIVKIDTSAASSYSFDAGDWRIENANDPSAAHYYAPTSSAWSSGNGGIFAALGILGRDNQNPLNYPTRKADSNEAYEGSSAIKMVTIEGTPPGKDIFGRVIPIWAGNFFMGSFDFSTAMSDELGATKVGRCYTQKPDTLKGWYKYTRGANFNDNGTIDPSQKDSCNIYAALYQSDGEDGRGDTTLAVLDAEVSDLRRAETRISGCDDTGGEWKAFALPFEYTIDGKPQEVDFARHRYKLAITFSSSKRGGAKGADGKSVYKGAVGSTLFVDEVEVVNAE